MAALALVMLSSMASLVLADDIPIVNGKIWGESSASDKRAYLIGASNFIVLEHAYQSAAKPPVTPFQSSVPDFVKHTDNVTLDQAISGIDGWYTANPGSMDRPVLTVLWDLYVDPEL